MTACSILLPCLLPLLGAAGLPLGVPPLPETAVLAKIAPEQCLFYVSSAGTATPDPKSANQTEQLLAEPELQKIMAAAEVAMKTNLGKALEASHLLPGTSADEVVDFVAPLLSRPMALYVSDVQMSAGRPAIHGAAVIHCGDDADKVKAKLEEYAKNLPPQMAETVEIGGAKWQSVKLRPDVNIVWGFKHAYLLVAVGDGEMEALVHRAGGKPPQWLAKIHQDLPVDRVSKVGFVNVKALKGTFLPLAGPQAAAMFQTMGLDNVDTLVSVAGMDEKACVQRILVSLDGEPRGLMRFATVEPLSAAELASIPADSALALAAKIDPLAVFNAYTAVLGKLNPQAVASLQGGISQMEAMAGLKLRTDILKPLGDNFVLYASLGPMGIPSVTAVLQLKDPAQAAKTGMRLVQMLEMAAKMAADNPRGLKLAKQDVAGKAIFTVTGNGSLSFCMTEKELIAAGSPKEVEAYLTRTAQQKSLAQAPEVAAALQGEAGPTVLLYCDVPQLFDKLYPLLPMAALVLQQKGIKLDLSSLPPANVIRSHLTPLVTAVRRTKAGIEIAEQHPLPGVGIVSNVPMLTALLLPAVQAGRETARRMQSSNNLKQIGLAMLNAEHANKSFPPAYTADKDGKPLLSWRVHILPYLDQNDLYKQFHLDEPWDSEHNKPLVAQMPAVYKHPKSAVSGEGKTNYLTVRGEKTVFSGSKGVGLMDITDGTSSTVMTVEVSDEKAVVWTKPDDFEYDEKDPIKGLVGLSPGGFNAGFADGSVRFLSSSIDPKTLNALFTRNGGEPVDPNMLNR
jgi:prepilin-type processing-associated H-X9-DG protein